MTDLVLHIGLAKCGSTTIQTQGFLGQPNYLGRGGDANRYGNRLTSEFLRLSPVNALPLPGSLRAWGRRAYKHIQQQCGAKPTTCVLSSEVLSKPVGGSYKSLDKFLEQLKARAWPWGKTKVIVVFRAQGPRIGSMFAQNSHRYFDANQDAFTAYVEECLRTDASFQYFQLTQLLQERLGSQNVLPLFMEEIGTADFWTDLARFAGFAKIGSGTRVVDNPSFNARSTSERSWALRDPLAPEISRSTANAILTWGWPATLLPELRFKARNMISAFDCKARAMRFRGESQRAAYIRLTPELLRKISERYASENQKLAKLLGKDLAGLGYFGACQFS